MSITIERYDRKYIAAAIAIWNEVVEDGIAFPQENLLDEVDGDRFFSEQSFTGLAFDDDSRSDQSDLGSVVGLYILHPNNVGRCGHISNASYAVARGVRGKHIGEKLVLHSLSKAKELGFRVLQFNAVVASNVHARHLYQRLGFVELGVIPGGFRMPDGSFADIVPHYHLL